VASVSLYGPIHLGGDAPVRPAGPEVDRIAYDEASVRRLVGRLGDPRRLRACYEAGPTGYDLAGCCRRSGSAAR
jgi:hypothetical protein